MVNSDFTKEIYELAFGCDAINRDFSKEEVIEKLREFSNQAWLYEQIKQTENKMKYALIIDDSQQKSVTLHDSVEEAEHAAYEFFLDTYIAGKLGQYIHDPMEKLELEYLVNYFDGEITYEIIQVTE